MKRSANIILLSIILTAIPSLAVDIGSDTAVSRFSVQQVLNDGDRVAGFASLEAGFKLAGSGVSATFDSFFPVTGDIELSHGILTLGRDLIFRDISTIKELGDIVGDQHTLEFSVSMTCVPYIEDEASSFVIELVDTKGQPDDVESADWSFDGKFVAAGLGDYAAMHDLLRIYEFDGTQLVLKDSIPTDVYMEITSVRWHPTLYLLAVSRLSAPGDDFMVYEVNSSTGVLTKKDGLLLGGSAYAVAWHPTGDWVAIGKDSGSSTKEIEVYAVDSSGNITTPAVASADIGSGQTVQTQALSWDKDGDYLCVGVSFNESNQELLVFEYNQITPSLSLNSAKTVFKTVRAVDWNKTDTAFIAVGLEGTSGELLQIYEHDNVAGTLTKRDAKSDLNDFVRSVAWSPTGTFLGVGRDATSGNELRFYTFDSSDYFLSDQVVGFGYTNNVEAVRWSNDGRYISVGSDSNLLDIYELRERLLECVTFYDVNIFLNQDLYLKQPCFHFNGESVINGRGNVLTLAPTCTIIIDSDSSLMFKDITIQDVNGNNVHCTDASSTISFHDVAWIQDGDYTFTVGRFNVLKDFILIGDGHTFAYQTDQVSTVSTYGRLIVDNGMTFSYDPPIASRELIVLHDEMSQVILDGGTLHSTSTGMRLTRGSLVIDRMSAFSSEGSVESEAISLGSDLTIQWFPAAVVDYLQGQVVFE